MNESGTIVMSGFYRQDINAIREKAEQSGLRFRSFSEKDLWVAVVFTK